MNLASINTSALGAIHSFPPGAEASATVIRARLTTASMSEWPVYLCGTVVDAAGVEVRVMCWPRAELAQKLKAGLRYRVEEFDAEISGIVRDYVKGVGFSMHDCSIPILDQNEN